LLAAGEGSVWSLSRRSVTRIDPARNRTLGRPVRLPAFSAAVAVGAGALWVVDYDAGVLRKLDARDGHLLAAIPGVGLHAEAIVATRDAVWVASIGPWTTLHLHRLRAGVTVAAGYAWVVNPGTLVDGGLDMSSGTLVRIDPRTGQVATRPLPGSSRPAAITFAAGRLWIASPGNGILLRLDPRTLHETRIQVPF
jgi:streptogramin lyase